jgi:CRP-like cAMP-binding protein
VEGGEYLFHQGDKEDYLYILLEGQVAIEVDTPTGERVVLYQAEPVDILGWSSVTPVIRERTASAHALVPSKLLALDAIKLRQLCDEDHQLGYVIMRRLANVIATRLQVTRMELIESLSRAARRRNKIAPN